MNDYKFEQRVNCVLGCILAVASVVAPIIVDPQIGWWPWIVCGIIGLGGIILLFIPYKPQAFNLVTYRCGVTVMIAVFVISMGLSFSSTSEKKYPPHKVICTDIYTFKGHTMIECNEGRFEIVSDEELAKFVRPGDTLTVQIKGEDIFIRDRR